MVISIEKKLEQVLFAYPNRFGTEDLYISTHHALPTELLAWVKSQSQHLNAQISEIDGIRLDFDDGFGTGHDSFGFLAGPLHSVHACFVCRFFIDDSLSHLSLLPL